MRALEELKLMPQVRYLASVSGGSWFTTLYYYYQADYEVRWFCAVDNCNKIDRACSNQKDGTFPREEATFF